MTRLTKTLLVLIGFVGIVIAVRSWSSGGGPIEVFCRAVRRGGAAGGSKLEFVLNRPYRLTNVKVIQASKSGSPIWELAAADGPRPLIDRFLYGQAIEGMRSPAADIPALEPGAAYRLIVTAGRRRGEIEFTAP